MPGIIYLEIDGLGLPVLRDAMRDGSAPNMARWIAEDGYRLAEWETDLSSQTGASQAGILLGSNEDIPAFRWVEKETGRIVTCSSPADCAEIEHRRATGIGLLRDGGASRGNLLSGEADETILTVSRIDAEKRANPGYRAFLANGFNVTRALVLFFWEVVLEMTRPRPAPRAATSARAGTAAASTRCCARRSASFVRDLIVFGVLDDMMRGRPAVYATFSSYDEVAHHSGLERADTMEALRKLDQQFGRIERARPLRGPALRDRRPLRPRADAGRDVQAAPRLRARRARRAVADRRHGRVESPAATSRAARVGQAVGEATGRAREAGEEPGRRPRGRGARLGEPRASSTSWSAAAG